MRIVYIANHDQSNSNDDEGAITHALVQLGHDVQRLGEAKGHKARRIEGADLYLFHKWQDYNTVQSLRGIAPRVFWYFDLVDFPDPTIRGRCDQRIAWMKNMLPHVELGFCTDGDWVDYVNATEEGACPKCFGTEKNPDDDYNPCAYCQATGVVPDPSNGKLVWLTQGVDERVTGPGVAYPTERIPGSILFTGIRAGGRTRESFVSEMRWAYGDKFTHVQRGVHGRDMAELISRHDVVVAPDGPVTDNYWSNRVYNMLGFAAFLFHPRCARLQEQYEDGTDLVMYGSRMELHSKMVDYLGNPKKRADIAWAGYQRTMREHTYRHRCERLIEVVRERLL